MPLTECDGELTCSDGDSYPIVLGIPVLLIDHGDDLDRMGDGSRELVRRASEACLNRPSQVAADDVDAFVQNEILFTNGFLYESLLGHLPRYPIPSMPKFLGRPGGYLLDVGSNWGRWSIAAARAGYDVVAIDPNLEALLALNRVAAQLGCHERIRTVCCDARRLPFEANTFGTVYSYSVLQHFAKADTLRVFDEMARVLDGEGEVLLQFAHTGGVRQTYNKLRMRRLHPEGFFRIRTWSARELRRAGSIMGATRISAEGYFTLNTQSPDRDMLPLKARAVLRTSVLMVHIANTIRTVFAADSVWLHVRRKPEAAP